VVVSKDSERQLLEGEIMKPRNHHDVTGPFAILLAAAQWIGGVLERRKSFRDG
jgi:hypothetical protein